MTTKQQVTKISTFTPLKGKIFVTDLEEGMKLTRGGIILPDDNMKDNGIRPRWGKVWAVGPDIDNVKPGEWVLVEHGRWTLRIPLEFDDTGRVDVWMIEPAAIIVVVESDEVPAETVRYAL